LLNLFLLLYSILCSHLTQRLTVLPPTLSLLPPNKKFGRQNNSNPEYEQMFRVLNTSHSVPSFPQYITPSPPRACSPLYIHQPCTPSLPLYAPWSLHSTVYNPVHISTSSLPMHVAPSSAFHIPQILLPNLLIPLYTYQHTLSPYTQGVTKRCRLSWLTNSALVYEPKCRGWDCGVSANEYSCAHGAPNKLWRSNPYLTYVCTYLKSPQPSFNPH
jgi:hypothetical protein